MRFVHPCVAAVVLGVPTLACGKNLILGDDPVVDEQTTDPPVVAKATLDAGATSPSEAGAAKGEAGATPTPRVVFVTNKVYTADSIQGLNGADIACNAAAEAALTNLAGKRFVAWLSNETQSAKDRLGGTTGPWERVDGKRVADNLDQLVGRDLTNAISVDEDGEPASGYAWTGTSRGTPTYGFTCIGWTSKTGSGVIGALADTGKWSTAKTESCGGGKTMEEPHHHLYCFERDP